MHIPLAGGAYFAQVDIYDADLINVRWLRSASGYAIRRAPGYGGGRATVYMHRVILTRVLGAIPAGLTVDHRDGNPLNNRRDNLRLATKSQQMVNRRRRSLGGEETPYKGVSFHRGSGTWRAELRHKGRYLHLGHFASDVAAARAYDARARELYGAFAKLNFPDES